MIDIGSRLGEIEILGRLGGGGGGEVFLGFDEKLAREVAVKGLHADLADPTTRARFAREARTLSQLAHPNICAIYDFVHHEGDDYLVLERIDGRNLNEELQDGIPFERQLDIAIAVAEALLAAHQKGIIHRDLKLGNVMWTREGRVKVLDFGLARPIEGALRTTVAKDEGLTRVDRPEPAPDHEPSAVGAKTKGRRDGRDPFSVTTGASSWNDVFLTEAGEISGTLAAMSPEQARGQTLTTASDCFSFGLFLQHLATGKSAFGFAASRHELLAKVQRGDTETFSGIDSDLSALIRDLQAIAPEARPTAAQALERLRRLREKPARKRRLYAAGVAVCLLVLGSAKYTLDLRAEKNRAIAARLEAEKARQEAELARKEAEQVVLLLVGLFEVSAPDKALGRELTARQVLDGGATRLREALADQPLVHARLALTLGDIYAKLGLWDQAIAQSEESLRLRESKLGPDDLLVAESLDQMAKVLRASRRDSEPLLRRALAIRETRLGADSLDVANTLNNLAVLEASRGSVEEAEKTFSRVLAIREARLGPGHVEVGRVLINLAATLEMRRRPLESLPLLERALAIFREQLPPDHPVHLDIATMLASNAENRGQPEKAAEIFRELIPRSEKVLGKEHPRVAMLLGNQAANLLELRRFAEAEQAARKAVAIRESQLGSDFDLGHSLFALGSALLESGQLEEAEKTLRRAAGLWKNTIAADHPDSIKVAKKLAEVLRRQGRDAAAREFEMSLGANDGR